MRKAICAVPGSQWTMAWTWVLVVGLLTGCPQGKYDGFEAAPATDRAAAEKLWAAYLNKMGSRKAGKNPLELAEFFARPLLAHTDEDTFRQKIKQCLRRRSAGAFEDVEVESVKTSPGGLLLVVDSKAGQAAIPLTREGEHLKFADLETSTGDWSREAVRGPADMPEKPSLLYIKVVVGDEHASTGERLRAAVALSDGKYRKEIIHLQRTVTDPIVRLGLGLARIKIDGSDASFVRNFPAEAMGISALAQADPVIFEEMMTKMSNLGAMQVDPPANEALYRTAAAAPADFRDRMGKALYDMAEQAPDRMANAVRNVASDPAGDATFDIYLAEVRRRGKATKMMRFLKKFSRIGEPDERKLCKTLLERIQKAL